MIGEKIRAERKKNGLTARELADKIGTTEATISRLERGITPPSPEIVLKISEVLGKSESILFAYMDDNPIFRAIIRLVFPELNNIRKEIPSVLMTVIQEAREAIDAADEQLKVFLHLDFAEKPNFYEQLSKNLEQLLDVKRAIEEYERRLILEKILSFGDLSGVYENQQAKCEANGHHRLDKEESAA